ncbi:MAG: right-handed parallel beta-helix repeat-containing protein [Candidatus Binatus sp.]|uniref:right-handed parallel beta-helix repeat-containing protein n=1 Tax=Candidatus Binatus sp. TaxID=2811406 RepID=UPI00271BC93F|nr:right-handed parallel beta-helix repeat-containing protein [Candidatus Binatus sp.]MDO8432703.1 right-handed parallel beta-helix repeat-containing protein [Candidatus Binatus sp.]
MRKILTAALIASAGFLIAGIARSPAQPSGRDFYVDTAGDDTHDGASPSSAWRSLAKLNSTALAPGDTIHLKRGCVWRETLEPRGGGEPARPVTLLGYGAGDSPVVSGSDLIDGWSRARGFIYRAYCPRKPNNVYVDGEPGWGLTPSDAIAAMAAGSWFWDATGTALYVWLPDGADPARHSVEAAVRLHGMKVLANGGEKSNIVVDGLTFARTGGYGIYFFSNSNDGRGLSGVVIRNNRVMQTGTGRRDGGEYYNAIHFSEHLQLNTAPQFINNSISYSGGHGNAINSQNADCAQLIGNRADHFNHHGFDTKHSANVVIRGNIAHDSPDNNGIYQEYCLNGLIERNVVFNLGGSVPGRGSGIQIDVGSAGARIFRNSIFNVLTGIYLTVPATAKFNAVSHARNAVLEANAGGIFGHNVWGDNPVFLLRGSRYPFAEWRASHYGEGDLAADPQWIDPAGGNFGLLASSPCLAMEAGASPVSPEMPKVRF